MNNVVLTGKIYKTYDSEDIEVAILKTKEGYFTTYWQKGVFGDITTLLDKHVVMQGNLVNVRLDMPNKAGKRMVAVSVRGINAYDI